MTVFLYVGLATFAAAFVALWIRTERTRGGTARLPSPGQAALGFGTDFFDTLGIGSFAPTATVFRLTGMVPDRLIPGTMNVGHTLPVVVMAFLYIATVEVDPVTLVVLIGSAVVGAWFGAGLVAHLPQRPIQVGIGCALAAAAVLMALGRLEAFPVGGDALGLTPTKLAAAAVVCAVLGALNTLGVGFYGPCLILIALLGMNPKAAFPIMMGACAFLMPVGSARFVREGAYSLRPALGLTLGGIPAVLVAATLVRSLPLDALAWLVVVVASYTAVVLLSAAARGEGDGGGEGDRGEDLPAEPSTGG